MSAAVCPKVVAMEAASVVAWRAKAAVQPAGRYKRDLEASARRSEGYLRRLAERIEGDARVALRDAESARTWETVNTLALVPGDVLDCHGSLFRLVAWTVDAARALELAGKRIEGHHIERRLGITSAEYLAFREREENLRAFSTEYLGPVYAEPGREAIPTHWRSGWTVQGNHRATWRRLVKA